MNLWREIKKCFMINVVQELSNRPVLAKNNRIIIFGEDMSILGVWGQLLKISNYRYSNGRWWRKTDMDPKDLVEPFAINFSSFNIGFRYKIIIDLIPIRFERFP
jgi:hypothetical protein